MVYRGRPSTGCKRCRERKIKCDERTEGCIKCVERGLSCPGYDRTVDIFFRDETAHVEARAKKAKAKAIAARDARDGRDPRALSLQIRGLTSPGPHLMSSLIDRGIAFFMSHYSVGIDQPSIRSEAYHKHLSTDGFHPLIATTMAALGIAGIANLCMDPGLKREATRWYLSAIKMANAAISSPEEVKDDTTLVAVNLLGMFETTFNERSLSGWSKHVDGAASLVKMRGLSQFSTPAGQRMYLHTIGLLAMNCMGKGIPLPEYVHEMNQKMMSHINIKDPRTAFFFLHIKTIDLRAQILDQQLQDLADIIRIALELDEIAISIFSDVSPEWDYEEVPYDTPLGVDGGYYHVYSSSTAAQAWNWVRHNRIYLHDIIRNSILAGFAACPPTLIGPEYDEQLAQSSRTLCKLQSDILASMPQFLHDVPMFAPGKSNYSKTSDSSTAGANTASSNAPKSPLFTLPITSSLNYSSSPSSHKRTSPNTPGGLHDNYRLNSSTTVSHALLGNGATTDRLPIVRLSGGSSIVWALYVAGAMPTASPLSQDIVYTYLTRIDQEFGVRQAKILSTALKVKRYLDSRGVSASRICPQYLPPDPGPRIPYQPLNSKKAFKDPDLVLKSGFGVGIMQPAY